MPRHRPSPLGIVTDDWDRTEAQTRQALHSHIVWWSKRRRIDPGLKYEQKPSIAKVEEGQPAAPPRTLNDPAMRKEDDVYWQTETARVLAELVRPLRPQSRAREREVLLWAFLLRAIQTHLYMHACTPRYCLLHRATCRFFFPWPEQPAQQYDENTERVALRRGHAPDDQFVVPHNLELAAFSPGTVNVLVFDPTHGADQCRSYACKYCGKPEPWYFLETSYQGGEANAVKRYLRARNIGLCMCHNRLMGFRVVRSTKPTQFLWPQFVVDDAHRVRRSEEHADRLSNYPDEDYFLNEVQQYFFRNHGLWHLRLGQFFRYFSQQVDPHGKTPHCMRTDDDTVEAGSENARAVPPEPSHRHFDAWADSESSCPPGSAFRCHKHPLIQCASARRRRHTDLCVPRSSFIEPLGERRERFYEQRLLFGLPWHCSQKPEDVRQESRILKRWSFSTHLEENISHEDLDEHLPPARRRFSITGGELDDHQSFEQICCMYEDALVPWSCECCRGEVPIGVNHEERRVPCDTCVHALGFHQCEHGGGDGQDYQWRSGTLHEGKLDVVSSLWYLARRLVPVDVLKGKLDEYIAEGHMEADEKDSRKTKGVPNEDEVRVTT